VFEREAIDGGNFSEGILKMFDRDNINTSYVKDGSLPARLSIKIGSGNGGSGGGDNKDEASTKHDWDRDEHERERIRERTEGQIMREAVRKAMTHMIGGAAVLEYDGVVGGVPARGDIPQGGSFPSMKLAEQSTQATATPIGTHVITPPSGVWKAYGERCIPMLDSGCDIGVLPRPNEPNAEKGEEGEAEAVVALGAHRLILSQLWKKARPLLIRTDDAERVKLTNAGAWWRASSRTRVPQMVVDGAQGVVGGLVVDQPSPIGTVTFSEEVSKEQHGLEVDVGPKEDSPDMAAVELVDFSSMWWGKDYILRDMICFSYGQPINIERSRLAELRDVAKEVGFNELVKACAQVLSREQIVTKGGIRHTMSPSEDILYDEIGEKKGGGEIMRTESGTRGITQTKKVLSNLKHSFLEDEKDGHVQADGEEKPAKKRIGRVLSDLKRNIVESSRVISNASFHEKYEMIMTDRGILGEGINGPVRMAVHRETGKEVAVKRISMINLSEQRKQMLMSEVRIFLQVQHPNIVQLHEVYESDEDQAVLLVMELCTGRELFERLAKRQYYSELDAAHVTKQMIDACSYLHSHNICHRDLKLENWLYEDPSEDAKLKLCDFGFGQVVEPSVQLTATLGSLYYVAPEVLAGTYGLMCDMWSIGVIVYMLLSGTPPFDGKTDEEIISNVRKGKFHTSGRRWQRISEPAKHFVHSLLRKDPYERLSAAEALHHSWLREVNSKELSLKKRYRSDLGLPKEITVGQLQKSRTIDQSVVKDMRRLAINSAIKRAALALFSRLGTRDRDDKRSSDHRLGSQADVQHLLQQFKMYDENGTGKIDIDDFTHILKETLQISSQEAKQVFEIIAASFPSEEEENREPNKEGGISPNESQTPPTALEVAAQKTSKMKRDIDYGEFLTATMARRMALNTAVIREAFRLFDTEGKGFITLDGLRSLLSDEMDTTNLEEIMGQCNVDGEGMIDYNDFADLFFRDQNAAASVKAESDEDVEQAKEDQNEKHDEEEEEEKEWRGEGVKEARWVPSDEEEQTSKGNQEEECEDPGEDRYIQSDEEQLVTEDAAPYSAKSPRESSPPQNIKEPRYRNKQAGDRFAPSFSLSLAGSAEYDDIPTQAIHRVISMPSDVYDIKQLAGFHTKILRPFYANQPVSNVVMGLIRGTSLYARQAASHRLANIIYTNCGWFFIMPNPKYHQSVTTSKTLISKDGGKFRFVAWWIHTQFQQQLRHWFDRITYEGMDEDMHEQRRVHARREEDAKKWRGTRKKDQEEQRLKENRKERERKMEDEEKKRKETTQGEHVEDDDSNGPPPLMPLPVKPPRSETAGPNNKWDPKYKKERRKQQIAEEWERDPNDVGCGNPGDFQFSNVPKPEGYLHTYRDLHKEHVVMLKQLQEGVRGFLRGLFDDSFLCNSDISAGFHYPVRTQYSTLHLQVRINSGSVCREDGRGVGIGSLIGNLQADPLTYVRDERPLRYKVTENVKVSLLTAATQFKESFEYFQEVESHGGATFEVMRELAPLRYELGIPKLPTIEDKDDEDDDDTKKSKYIINLQPHENSQVAKLMHERQYIAETFGTDQTYLYPPHVSVTGFFECTEKEANQIKEMLETKALRALSDEKIHRSLSWPLCIRRSTGNLPPPPPGKMRYKNNIAPLHSSRTLSLRLERDDIEICTPQSKSQRSQPKHANSASDMTSRGERREKKLFKALGCLITPTNYVLLDVACPIVKLFAEDFAAELKTKLGINVRPKAVSHISLACGRGDEGPEVLNSIWQHYSDAWKKVLDEIPSCLVDVDIVMAKLEKDGHFDKANLEPHRFKELVRIPLEKDWAPTNVPHLARILCDDEYFRISSRVVLPPRRADVAFP